MVTPVESEALGTPEPRAARPHPERARRRRLDGRHAAVVLADGDLGAPARRHPQSVRAADGAQRRRAGDPADRDGGAAVAVRLPGAAPAGHASAAQRLAFHRQSVLDQRRHRAAARDRVRDRVPDAGVGRPARGAVPRRALHREPRRLDRARLSRRADHPAARHRGVPAGRARRAGRLARLCGVEHRHQEADPGAEHDRDPVLDEPDAGRHGADRQRSRVSAAARLASVDLGGRPRLSAAPPRTTA